MGSERPHEEESTRRERPDIVIREFTLADYDEVLALWLGAGPGVDRRPSDERDQVTLKVERDPDLFLVATLDGRIVGAVMGGWDGRRAYVYHLAVTHGLRHRGVADALMDELEERFRRERRPEGKVPDPHVQRRIVSVLQAAWLGDRGRALAGRQAAWGAGR